MTPVLRALLVGILALGAGGCRPPVTADSPPLDFAHAVRLNQTADPAVRQELFELLQPVALANCQVQRFGEPGDGGYLMCGNLLGEVESGYSYGISGYDGWGCDISTRLGVPVHQYDCFDTMLPACPNGRTIFHPECVAGVPAVDEGRHFDTVRRQVAANGDSSRRLVVKMDVEGAEWDALLRAPNETLHQIDQLAIELHFVNEPRFVAVIKRLKRFFHVAHLHFNNYSCAPGMEPFPAWAYEVLFVNRRLALLDAGAPPPPVHALAAPNNPDGADCQIGTP